jgi:hypothetical protein
MTIPNDVLTLQSALKTTVAKLMAHSQTVQELMKANLDLRAALHLAQTDKNQLEEYVNSLLNPPATPEAVEPEKVAEEVAVSETTEAAKVDAPSVQA